MKDSDKSKLVNFFVGATFAYAAYRLLVNSGKKRDAVEAVKATAQDVIDVPATVIKAATEGVKKAAKFVKGSPEAKAHMAALRAKVKSSGRPKKSTGHKGHATKRGLAQDQKMKSDEKHEKSYQKKKIPL